MSVTVATATAMDIVSKAPEHAERMHIDAPVVAEDDLYTKLKTLQKQLEFLEIQVCVVEDFTWRRCGAGSNSLFTRCRLD
jgi:hypothetical protein